MGAYAIERPSTQILSNALVDLDFRKGIPGRWVFELHLRIRLSIRISVGSLFSKLFQFVFQMSPFCVIFIHSAFIKRCICNCP